MPSGRGPQALARLRRGLGGPSVPRPLRSPPGARQRPPAGARRPYLPVALFALARRSEEERRVIPQEPTDPELKKVLEGIDEYVEKRNPKKRIKVLPSGPLRYVRIDLVLDERAGKDEIDEMLEEVTKLGEAKRVGEPDIANVLRRQRRLHGALFAFALVGVPLAFMATLVMLAWDGIYVHPLYEILQALPSWVWSRTADVVKVLLGFGGFFALVALVEVMRRRYAKAKAVVA